MSEVVLDSSAILAHLNGEPGCDVLDDVFGFAYVSTVNLAEVVGKLVEWKVPEPSIAAALSGYGLQIVEFDRRQAYRCGALRGLTKDYGLSIGDRACLALAEHLQIPVITADRIWGKLSLPIEVRVLKRATT